MSGLEQLSLPPPELRGRPDSLNISNYFNSKKTATLQVQDIPIILEKKSLTLIMILAMEGRDLKEKQMTNG